MKEFIGKLLETWRDTGKFGLSLPFIEGALRLKGYLDGPESEAFMVMLKELQESDTTYRLAYCGIADDFILAPVNGFPSGCKRVSENGLPTSLWVQHDLVENEIADTIELYEVLWKKYGSNLEVGNYSCTKGKYHEFTLSDLALIEKAYTKNA